ncbi:hypothetical protein SAMN04488558_101216 [Ignavigranum ruoffiae]|uniref:Uncharacterized protein n=1 Tax=Ignavigranum ruoffiae TaxID=89093 RepID=A0A1H8ZCW2_9LACT|nr:DUF5960 family protein [Ignavigranum ruoffiae]SEP62232.1 hypothetical protein SAMN04488558_101216 [Ignavigranum ruoffiae]
MMTDLKMATIQFDYFQGNYAQFEADFNRFSTLTTPLTFMTDDLLRFMHSHQLTYFRLNAKNASDGRDHYFLFDLLAINPQKTVFTYSYLGHDDHPPTSKKRE